MDPPEKDTPSLNREPRLLVVDDDPLDARLLQVQLENLGARVESRTSAAGALAWLGPNRADAVITDLIMEPMDGIDLTRAIRRTDPAVPIIVVTAQPTLPRAVEAIRAGATDFFPKPLNAPALLAMVERAIGERPLREELAELRLQHAAPVEERVVGSHPLLDEVRALARRLAGLPSVRVLITGESGTGKSMLARAIHDHSGLPGRFVELNCAALPGSLLESELFGHEKGAFTDARDAKRGLVELAHDGTLFLDEIGAMPLELQAKLLLLVEGRDVRRVGGETPLDVNVRIVSATHEDLAERVREGAFREDLLYRLDVARIEVPPLRDVSAVVPELARHFTEDLCWQHNRPLPDLDPAAFEALMAYPWPGNARELRNAVERSLIFHEGGPLYVRPPGTAGPPVRPADDGPFPPGLTLEEVERRYIERAIARGGERDLEEIARELGISRKSLWERRKRYGL